MFKTFKIKKNVHPNLKFSSSLIFASILFGLINFFLVQRLFGFTPPLPKVIVPIILMGVIGWLIRKGYKWVRILLFIIVLIGVIAEAPKIVDVFKVNIFVGLITVIQFILEIYSMVLLFKSETWVETGIRN
jgi:hypothetical protein